MSQLDIEFQAQVGGRCQEITLLITESIVVRTILQKVVTSRHSCSYARREPELDCPI